MQEYKKREKELEGYSIRYLKGLGSLQKSEMSQALKEPHLQIFKLDDGYQMLFYKWFGKKHIKDRKDALKEKIV